MKLLTPNITSIELFCRAANYLSAGMLYLKCNPLLREKLQPHHFKERILGHWGTCPGVNLIYAHSSDLSRRSGQRMRFILGTGHAAPAMLSSLYLEGSLEKIYPQFTRDIKGLSKLFSAFATPDGFSTEINPQYPGMLYSGGELGSALAFAQGYALNNPQSFSICVIGDGELETSITQASWQGFKFLSPKNDGKILPVINANGYKMGSKSLHALKPREEQESLYKGHGLTPIFVGTNYTEIAEAFNQAFIALIESKEALQPVIVLESPKGWTAPNKFGNEPFEGSYKSHKPILRNPSQDHNEIDMLEKWLKSYKPNDLFDDIGTPIPEIAACLPSSENFLGSGHQVSRRSKNSSVLIKKSDLNLKNAVTAISSDLVNRIKISKDIIVFSPDELLSNKFSNILEATKLKYNSLNDISYTLNGQVIEILNEHLCYAWAQGYSMAGNQGIFVSYEAFSPLLDSMSSQHLKFLDASINFDWRSASPSMNIILTSLGWNNCHTHHNPGYVDTLIGRNLAHVRVYMPVTPAAALHFFREMINSHNRLNVMVINKYDLPKISSNIFQINEENFYSWRILLGDTNNESKISLVAIGDCMAEESLYARDIIKAVCPELSVQVLVIEDLSLLETSRHLDIEHFKSTIADSLSCVWAYNGYPKIIKGFLWNLGMINNHQVLGYQDRGHSAGGLDRFIENEASRFHIAREAIRLLKTQNTDALNKIEQQIYLAKN